MSHDPLDKHKSIDLKLFRPTAINWFVARRDGGMARDGGSRFTLERYPLG
jgi:hypothetical protein